MEQTVVPRRVASIHQVTQELWDSADRPLVEQALEAVARQSMSKLGTVVSDLSRQVAYEVEIDGIRLHGYDEFGNELPPMVAVHFTAYVIPNEEDDQ